MSDNIIMRHKNIIRIVLATVSILIVLLVAMQFTDEVNWDLTDFIAMGTLLIGTGLIYGLIVRKVSDIKYRGAIGIALTVVLFIIWAELAVGIFGTPFAGQ